MSSPEAYRLFLSGPSQLGTFKSDDGDYFVEPLLSLEEQEFEEEHNKPHLVYRHRTPPTNSSGDRQTCDTPGTRFVTALDDLALYERELILSKMPVGLCRAEGMRSRGTPLETVPCVLGPGLQWYCCPGETWCACAF